MRSDSSGVEAGLVVVPTGVFVAATFWVREVSRNPLVQTALLVGVLFGSYGVMRWVTERRGVEDGGA